jgi:putative transposase
MSRRLRPAGQAPSNGYLRARRQAARLHKKAANQNRHAARIWAKSVVDNREMIAAEDLKPVFAAKSTMARKSADAAIGAARAELIQRGTRAGATVVKVPPAYPAMTCSRCGEKQARLRLAMRTLRCAHCGFTAGRDRNAARVILATAERIRAGVDDVRHLPPPSGLVASAVRARNPPASAVGNR